MPRVDAVPALRVVTGPSAADDLAAAIADPGVGTVLVHDGVELAPGAEDRLVAELARPGRRLVRVLAGDARCYLAEASLLREALARTDADLPALAAGDLTVDRWLSPFAAPAPAAEQGQWRHWVDGAVIGVRPVEVTSSSSDGWVTAQARRHGTAGRLRRSVRQLAGRVRRSLGRRRDRTRAQPR